MKKNSVLVLFSIDRSGSMASIQTDIIGGFNKLLEDQKKTQGQCSVTLATWDYGPYSTWAAEKDGYQVVYDMVDISNVKPLNKETYVPRGNTAVYDSSIKLIDDVGAKLAGLPEDEKPEKVLVILLSDGESNSDRKYTKEDLKQRIKHQTEKYNWQFSFVGANFNVYQEAQQLGIARGSTLNYCADSIGTQSLFDSLSTSMKKYRCSTDTNAKFEFSEEDQEKQDELLKNP